MALSKDKKRKIVDDVAASLKSATTTVFASFKGINVAEVSDLRRTLRTKDVKYRVIKKTLLARVLDGLKLEGNQPEFSGQVSVCYGGDALAPARELFGISKKLQGKLSLLGGIFGGKYINRSEMEAIALIPSRETLLAQFVNVINSPIQGLVVALGEIAKKKI